ncbi:MAG: alanine racemase [Chloroflexi bacterium]|nr:alanine racemase [Chloroflexota bacterium]
MTLGAYPLSDAECIPTPAVVVFRHYLEANLRQTIELAGGPERLRPHCKTHKTREIVRRWIELGVTVHKCATLREAAMCLEAGARDVLVAYQLTGPLVDQFAQLAQTHQEVRLAALVDTPAIVQALDQAAAKHGVTLGAMVDLDVGLHRTGVAPEEALSLCEQVQRAPHLRFAGLHNYDANNRSPDVGERARAVAVTVERIDTLRKHLDEAGISVTEVVSGGSATAHLYARLGAPYRGSPGTTVFWDHGYAVRIPDLDPLFVPAALLLSRVISRPGVDYVTLDAGNKAIAADPPVGQRGLILGLEDAMTSVHNEEHWSLRSAWASRFMVGDTVLIVPEHVCPCSNLHPVLYVIGPDGALQERWEVAARQRALVL